MSSKWEPESEQIHAIVQESDFKSWTSLEPDPTLFSELRVHVQSLPHVQAIQGTLQDLPRAMCFDSILYIDVLEHIMDENAELRRAVPHLHPGGSLIVLSPAHLWLYSPFDSAIGHFRRYSATSLRNVAPTTLKLQALRYLDSIGMLASLGNRLLLRQSEPSESQILFWDRRLVPISRFLDPLLAYKCGKSVLAIWRRAEI